MDSHSFDQIAQALFTQKQLMDQLEAENLELRKRLADLRAGRGIFVDIAQSRFALQENPAPSDRETSTR